MAQPQAARAAVRILREGGHQLDDLAVRE